MPELPPKRSGDIANFDDYSACEISKKQDWRDLFVTPFYFGCEADDPSNVWAFNAHANPLDARLNAIFSSDIGHFDVPDMTEVVPEAYEMVEDGLASATDFRDFTFANAVRLFGRQNPRFSAGSAASLRRLPRCCARPRRRRGPPPNNGAKRLCDLHSAACPGRASGSLRLAQRRICRIELDRRPSLGRPSFRG